MAANVPSYRKNRGVLIEALEARELLSASMLQEPLGHSISNRARATAVIAPLAGSYRGTLHLNGGPAARTGGPARRAISISFSSAGIGAPLSGTVSVGGLGDLAFTGTDDGNHLALLLTGAPGTSGELTGTLSQRGHLFSGKFVENIAGRTLNGSFHVGLGQPALSVGTAGTTSTSGSTMGSNTTASGIGGFTGGLTSPISGIGAPVSGTSATGTILGTPITGGVSTPVTGGVSTPVTGGVSVPITGATTPPVGGNVSTPVSGNLGGAGTLNGAMLVFPSKPRTTIQGM
ncbi:MAG TPA: hypothetical protein VN541_12135 [Tepidisphaeraceae bacterium]|nr:hypothetical protein [Tepidisphaeraceae bacterium]